MNERKKKLYGNETQKSGKWIEHEHVFIQLL